MKTINQIKGDNMNKYKYYKRLRELNDYIPAWRTLEYLNQLIKDNTYKQAIKLTK